MKRKILFLYTLFLCASMVVAQNISVSAPAQVAVGENFRLEYTINTQDVENFRVGTIPEGLEVIAGPYSSVQSSFRMINGRTTSSSSITYTYTLYAEKNGKYTIPPAQARVAGKNVASKAVHITVSGNAHANMNRGPKMHSDDDNGMRPAGTKISGSDLFVKLSANKKHVYEQEPLLLTYKVYSLVDLTSLDGKMPDLTGFHTQEIKLPIQKSWHLERLNGRNYKCVTWSQYVMYPQMTGKLKIPSLTFKGVVVQQNKSVDPFEAFFNGGSGYVEVNHNIVAPGMDIQVDPLPQKPAGFSGGVGRFDITANVDNANVKAGDPITLRVVVSGVGNLKLMKQPVVAFPKDFDKYDPKVTDKTSLTTAGLEGNMIYDYLVVPRNQGKYVIPAINFVYFDINTKSYKTVKTKPIEINVAKGNGKSADVEDYASKKDQDIRPLKKGDTKLHKVNDFFFGSATYLVSLLIPFVAFVVLLVVFRKRAIDNADVVKMKGRKANKVAVRRLKKANKLMVSGRQNDFYDEVMRALWGYVGDKLNMPVEQLSRDNISENLMRNQIKEATINKFLSALDECEFERYAPGDAKGNMGKTYDSAIAAIMDIEDSLKMIKKGENKTKSAVVCVLLMLMPLMSYGVTKNDVDALYTKGNYQKAITGYHELLKQGVSADLYYNLGNAYYRSGDITKAIISYERASVLSPGDNDIRFNLQFVRNKTIDKIMPKNEMFFVTWYRSVVNAMSVDGWARLSVFTVVSLLVLLLLFLFGNRMYQRKVGFYGASFMLILFIMSNVFAYQQQQQFKNHNYAIVTAPSAKIKKTPADNSEDAFVIHEGCKVDITDKTMKQWRCVEFEDGREGWIKTTQIEEI